jgi:5'-methylthioadenosine nucleosidase
MHRGAEIGDVYVSDQKFVHHDRRIAIPGFEEYGIGSYPAVPASGLAQALNLKLGIVTTSNSLDENDDDRRLIAASGGAVKEMEAAAVAYVGEMMAIPVMGLKAITDLVDHHTATADQFNANLITASRRLAEKLLQVIDFCAPRSVADLG